MNRLVVVAVVFAVNLLAGCATVDPPGDPRSAEILPPAQLSATSTADLTLRRAQLHEMIAEIRQEVELKAGLHMGVAIHDDRARLAELYLEARQIDRELLRRWNAGEGQARSETVKADFHPQQ
jgi:outer membrane murein-binding lipoprotein Lpp